MLSRPGSGPDHLKLIFQISSNMFNYRRDLESSKFNLDKFERTGIKDIQCCTYIGLHHGFSTSFNPNKLLSSSCFSSSLVWVVLATQSRWPWC